MTPRQLNCALAQRTGEDVQEIQRRGFSIADPFDTDFDPEPDDTPPQTVDWDQLELNRNVAFFGDRRRYQA